MKEVFLAIKARAIAELTAHKVTYVQLYNSQQRDEQKKDGGEIYSFPKPAILVEFEKPLQIEQLGNGVQMYNPLVIKLRVLHDMYNADDGTMEQNLEVLVLAQDVYKAFQDWMSETVALGVFTRINDNPDYDHNNVNEFIQTYQTTYIDYSMARPVGGQQYGPVNLEVQMNNQSIETEDEIILTTETELELTIEPEIMLP